MPHDVPCPEPDEKSCPSDGCLVGLWIDADGKARLALDAGEGPRRTEICRFRPFVWADDRLETCPPGGVATELSGPGNYRWLVEFEDLDAYQACLSAHARSGAIDWVRALEHQFLLRERRRLYENLPFDGLRRLQLDIETDCAEEGGFSEARRREDRVLAVGLRCGEDTRLLALEKKSDRAERSLLERLNESIQEIDPDVIEGHNLFKFDLDYLRIRAKRLGVPCAWGRFGQAATFRSTRLRVAERWIDYPRCDAPGRALVDTYLLAQIHDLSTRELMGYGLKEVARHLGVTPASGEGREYIDGAEIKKVFEADRRRFLAYLEDDLRETEGVAAVLLPTYYEQAKAFPTTLQEACLRGTASKVDLVFQEAYFHRRAACPAPREGASFAGGYTASFEQGVFRKVLHFDVASLYPSLLLLIGRDPGPDAEGIFIPTLKQLREYRLKYKRLARETGDPSLKSEYDARQASFKILVNSFYGYLGFSGARFGDRDLAAEVTAKGRELLKKLIEAFRDSGCQPLEADTDGLYVASLRSYDDPAPLLERVQATLPEGIDLEFDGRYESMFCYKAKNYALYDGEKVVIRGSALRSRGIEPFLKKLTLHLIEFLLGARADDPAEAADAVEKRLRAGEMPLEELAKSEILSMNPEAYRKKMEAGGKPRRASAEVALQIGGQLRMGDRVSYYIGPKASGQTADWQRARPLDGESARTHPYDPAYYLKKLEDWRKRYGPFHPKLQESQSQGQLL